MRKVFVVLWFFCAASGFAQTKAEQEAVSYFKSGVEHFNKHWNNEYKMAIADFTQAIRLNPDNASYYHWRGAAYCKIQEYDMAIVDLNWAIRLNPNNADCYYWRGYAYYDRHLPYALRHDYAWVNAHWDEDMERAIADFEAALRIDPNHAEAQKKLVYARNRAAGGPVRPSPPASGSYDDEPPVGPPPPVPGW
jgi:tetratricopeptide (TPR) repeat protein